MNKHSLIVVFLLCFAFPQQSFALPPPDLLISLGQSLIAALGTIAIFLTSGFFLFRQFLKDIWLTRKKLIITTAVLVLFGIMGMIQFVLWKEVKTLRAENNTLRQQVVQAQIDGEMLTIDEVISKEETTWLRIWKQRVLAELTENLQDYRIRSGLSAIDLKTVESYEPKSLALLTQIYPNAFLFLDTREDFELTFFSMPGSKHVRYGDLINGIDPDLPKDKKIVVLCYSGIRGYLTANILLQMGYQNVAYIQGGLGNWSAQGLPLTGTDRFDFLEQTHRELTLKETKRSAAKKYILSEPDSFLVNLFPEAEQFWFEMLPTAVITREIASLPAQQRVVLICDTDSSCFDGANFAYLLEQSGKIVDGYYRDKDLSAL